MLAVVAGLLLGGLWSQARAQPAASPWTAVELPGGVAGLRRVLGPSVDAGRVFVETARRIDSPDEDEAGSRGDVRAYVEAVDDLWQALGRLPGRTARLAVPQGRRPVNEADEAVVAALGARWRGNAGNARLAIEPSAEAENRRRSLAAAGLDVEALVRAVNAGATVDVSLPVALVPLPMAEAGWQQVAFEGRRRGGIARAVITDRRASLLAHGLAACEPHMLAWFTARPVLLRDIYRDHAGGFAVFGRSLRVEQGRIVPPGGTAGRAAWERLVGEPTSDPERFILSLLGRGEGRLAWLYDTVAHLDGPHVEHLLGAADGETPGPGRMEVLERVFASIDAGIWQVEQRPFRRPSPDPALFLEAAALDAKGRLVSPISRAGWDLALDGRAMFGDENAPVVANGAGSADVDLAWLTERVFGAPARAVRERRNMALFAQRVFASAGRGAPGDVVVALQGFLAFPALALTLERMGLTAPSLYAAAARAASRLSGVGDDADRYRLLMQFQGAVALVWRLHGVGTIDSEAAERLLSRVFGLRVDPKGRFAGGVARWVGADLLPAIGIAPGTADVEEALVTALSGRPLGVGDGERRPPIETIEWEGLPYVLDLAGADARALRATRESQQGYTMDQVLAVSGAADALTLAGSVESVATSRAAITGIGGHLPPIRASAGVPGGLAMEPARLVEKAVAELNRVGSAEDLERAHTAGATLVALGDAMLADTLSAWAYAVAVLGSDDPGVKTIGLVRRHDLSPRNELDPDRRRGPWALPRPVPLFDVPWHIGGALLALDFAFAESRLRRIEADTLPLPRSTDDSVRFALAQHALFLDARRLTDEARDTIVAAVARGRVRAADAAEGRAAIDSVALAAGISEWRRESLRWLAGTDAAAVPEALSLGELLYVGLDGEEHGDAIAMWGPSEEPLTGALRAHLMDPRPWEPLAGHRGIGMVVSRFMDLVVRVAQALSSAHLPAALAPAVLAAATWDLCADARLSSADDWLALVEAARAIPGSRFDDYVATLTGDGPLAPPPGDSRNPVP